MSERKRFQVPISSLCLFVAVVALSISLFLITAQQNAQITEQTRRHNAQLTRQAKQFGDQIQELTKQYEVGLVFAARHVDVTTASIADRFLGDKSYLVDSLGFLELIAQVEERFGLEIDFEGLDAEELTRVGAFVRYVAAESEKAEAA